MCKTFMGNIVNVIGRYERRQTPKELQIIFIFTDRKTHYHKGNNSHQIDLQMCTIPIKLPVCVRVCVCTCRKRDKLLRL